MTFQLRCRLLDSVHVLSLSLFLVFPALGIAKDAPVILYLYGDVAADGTVPSGDKPPFHQMRLDDEGNRGLSQFKEALEEVGFEVKQAYDAETTLDPATLKDVDVLILGSNQRRFQDEERKAVSDWVSKGGGIIGWSDSAFGGHYREVGVDNDLGRLSNNDIMEPFGMYFMTDNGAGNYLVTQYEEPHFLNRFEKDGGIAFRGEGVSPVRVSSPARLLAKVQEGGLGGGLRLNKRDGKLDPERDAALAIAEIDKGRAIGVFDRNLFWNAGEGTRLSHSDNREFAQRLALWAAGLEDDSPLANKASKSSEGPASNTPPKVQASHRLADDGSYVDLAAKITDDDKDSTSPEITWKQVQGPEGAEFENNNANTATVRVFLKEPGKYRFAAIVKDGEFVVRRNVNVTVP